MNREEQVEKLTTYIAHFTDYIGKHLPDDVKAKISELAEAETNPLAKSIYETMNLNQRLASELNRPSCQDTGVIQFWVKCGTKFPLIDDILQGNLHAYKGAVFENLIADIFSKMGRKLYYFHKDSGLEVDFVIRYKGECTLVEVKASTGNTKSTRTILNHPEKYHVSHAIKLGDYNVGRAEQILTLPLYMAFLLKEI